MQRPVLARAIRNRRFAPREQQREGFEFQGRWITPEEAHKTCKAVMDKFDRLRKEDRDYVNSTGKWPNR